MGNPSFQKGCEGPSREILDPAWVRGDSLNSHFSGNGGCAALGPPALQREASAKGHETSLLHLGAHGGLIAWLRNGLLFSGLTGGGVGGRLDDILLWHHVRAESCTPSGEPGMDSTIHQRTRKKRSLFGSGISFLFGEMVGRE